MTLDINHTSGGGNLFLGKNSGRNTDTGGSNAFVGALSGFNNTSGNGNSFLGYGAGYNSHGSNNTFVGYNAGQNVGSGDRNISIGSYISSASSLSDQFIVGNNVVGTFMQGDMATGPLQVKGGTTTLSDARLKTSVVTLENSLDKVLALRGVTYHWKPEYRKDNREYVGFIAQEVQKSIA